MKYSIIVPVFNEEKIIKEVIENLFIFLEGKLSDFEIIAINDGSVDNSLKILSEIKKSNFSFFSNPYNKGYGSSLKLGVKFSRGEYVIFFDGDGQHRPEDLLSLIKDKQDFDLVIGSRQGYKGPALRQPGKRLMTTFASYLVNFNIPDLNSGLRLIKKERFNKFIHLYPERFSLSTTNTLAFIKEGYNVKFIPIKINERVGKSTVKISDGIKALNLITRMIMLFSPMKIFLPASLLFFLFSIISFLFSLLHLKELNISDTTLAFLIISILMFFIGLIADQIASIRREINK